MKLGIRTRPPARLQTAHGFAFKFGGSLWRAGWINDRYFDRNMKVLRQWDGHFLARPASA